MPGEEPKLIIDTDWKSQAQAEKERLAQKVTPPAATGPAGSKDAPGPDEPVKFHEVVQMIGLQALSYLGELPDPRTGQRMVAPEYARLYIDMLGVLEEKTKGNLAPDEQEFLSMWVGDLRLAYVEISKAVAKAVQEGKIKPMSPGVTGGVAGMGAPPGAGPLGIGKPGATMPGATTIPPGAKPPGARP